MKIILKILVLIISWNSFAQTDSTKKTLKISGYLDTYYAYDFGNPSDHNRPNFAYSFNRHNEVNINLGFLKADYKTEKVRANLALMTGTYANANLAAEQGVLKNIFEANVGVKLSNTKNLWVDAGIFASHIGFESAVGKDNWNLTRSIMADNTPYFESGAKISYTNDNQKWFVSSLILNGWQNIQRNNGNNTPAFGHQVTFKPTSKIIINSSSFVGSDSHDSTRLMRYFHNFYTQIQLHQKFGIIAGFDIGAQQKSKGSNTYNIWYNPTLIFKYSLTDKINIAARGEYYNNLNGVIVAFGTPNGFQTLGYSLGLDYNIASNIMWRIEARGFNSRDKIFTLEKKPSNQNYLLTTSLAISF